MDIFEPGTFVRVLAWGENRGRLGIVVEPRPQDATPSQRQAWVEVADPAPFGGVRRVLYDVTDLRVAHEIDRKG